MCMFSFISHLLSYTAYPFLLLLLFCYLPTSPPNLKPLDVGIQFVLYVSFLLWFRFIWCRLLLINSMDMQWEGAARRGLEEEGVTETERQIKTPHIRQWVTPAIIYHLDSSAEAPCSLPWQPVPWWLIPCQCGIAAGNRAHELTVPATSF